MPDILDIFVAKIPNCLHTQTQSLLDPCLDHSPVLLTVDCHSLAKLNLSTLSQYWTDWEKFGYTLYEKTDLKLCLKTAPDIDDAVNLLTNNVQLAVWKSAIQPHPKRRLHLIFLFTSGPSYHWNVDEQSGIILDTHPISVTTTLLR